MCVRVRALLACRHGRSNVLTSILNTDRAFSTLLMGNTPLTIISSASFYKLMSVLNMLYVILQTVHTVQYNR